MAKMPLRVPIAVATGFCATGLCLGASAAPVIAAHAKAETFPVKAFLCDSADHAIRFADIRARGGSEEIARDQIGRSARAEVCGRYVGIATIQSETVMLTGGIAYKLTAFRFQEDKRVAWLAETTFAPPPSDWPL